MYKRTFYYVQLFRADGSSTHWSAVAPFIVFLVVFLPTQRTFSKQSRDAADEQNIVKHRSVHGFFPEFRQNFRVFDESDSEIAIFQRTPEKTAEPLHIFALLDIC